MKKNNALTFIELIIASLVFVVLMLAVYSAFRGGALGRRNIEDKIEAYQAARQVLERINLDLRNSFCYSKEDAKFSGENNRLEFMALVDSYQNDAIERDYALVAYELSEDKILRLCRKNSESLKKDSGQEPQEMAANIKQLSFSYGMMDSKTKRIEFKYALEDKTEFPQSVKIKLSIKNSDRKTEEAFERTIFLPLS